MHLHYEQAGEGVPVADIHCVVHVARDRALQLPELPRRRALLAEEHRPHVVVDADDLEAVPGEEPHAGGADEAGGSGDDGDVHSRFPSAVTHGAGGT